MTESLPDLEVVQFTLEEIKKTISEFCEVDMRKKLRDCQRVRVLSHQLVGSYERGDKVRFQQREGKAWFGPALVLCQRGQSVWLHSIGDIKKVASCKVKPYDLVERKFLILTKFIKTGKLCWRMA